MNMFGSSNVGSQMQGIYHQQQTQQNQGLRDINSQFAGFNPEWYNKAQQGYINSNLPGVEQQNLGQQRQLGLGLANQGLYNSSVMNHGQQQIQNQLGMQKQQVVNGALNYHNAIQQLVEQQRQRLMSQLGQAGSPLGMQQSLLGQAAGMGSPNPMASIGQSLGGLMSLGGMAAAL